MLPNRCAQRVILRFSEESPNLPPCHPVCRPARRAVRVAGRLLFGLLCAALLTVAACDDFFPDDDFTPTGTPFNLNPGLALVSITGGERPLTTGTYTIDITCRALTDTSLGQSFPAGVQFRSTQRRVQHVVVLKPQSVEFGAAGTVRSLGVFCSNRYRRTPDPLDTFELGPVTDNRELQEIASLVRDKDISGALWLVQRAVWMVTDSTGLNQPYRDSLAALPAGRMDYAGPGKRDARRHGL